MSDARIRHAALAFAPLLALAFAMPALAGDKAVAHTTADRDLDWGGCPAFMPDGCRIAVLNGDPARRNADIFYRVPGGAHIDRHWHHSPERMVLVTGRMEVTYDGQEPVMLEAGTYAYGPAEKPHIAVCRSPEPCTLFIAFVQPIDAMPGSPD